MGEIVCAHVVVRGRVQGVGYRAFTQGRALAAALTGWVRNCQDGSVECEVQGERTSVEIFLDQLREGPAFSKVETVQVDWKGPNRQTEGFVIQR